MKTTRIGVLVLTAAIFFSLTGCGSIENKIAEKTAEGIAEKTVGGKVDITQDGVKVQSDEVNYETGKDLKWPKGAMGELPEPKAKISAVVNAEAGKGGSVAFGEMGLEDAKAYVEKLKELGYMGGLSISDEDLISHSGKNGSGASVIFNYSISPKEGSILYKTAGDQ